MYARGNDRRRIYVDDRDRRIYLTTLAAIVVDKRWRCLAYCLMDNHVHLLLETPEANLAAGMQRLHGQYAQMYNKRHGRSGHVFQGRYGATRITSDEQLWLVVAYVARNPVEAGRCERPEQWRWSSHAATLQRAGPRWLDVPRLLWYLAPPGADALQRYADLVKGSDPLT